MTQITIDLSSLQGPEGSVADAIVAEATRQLMDSYDIRRKVIERVESITDEEVRARLRPLVEAAVSESVQQTDRFGQPKGEPTTLREVIVREATSQLKRDAQNDRIGYRRTETLIEQIVSREVQKAVGEDLRAVMDKARAEVREAVRSEAAEVITATITRLARV